jgi:hypothetical protein
MTPATAAAPVASSPRQTLRAKWRKSLHLLREKGIIAKRPVAKAGRAQADEVDHRRNGNGGGGKSNLDKTPLTKFT